MSNTMGILFRFTIFGDSHGKAIGGIVDGCTPGMVLDEEMIKMELKRRSGGSEFFSSPRKEPDHFELLSGIRNGKATGGPIGFIIPNKNVKTDAYAALDTLFRPSHADFTYFARYGATESAGKLHASGRLFAAAIVAGAIAKQMLKPNGIHISGFVKQIGNVSLEQPYHKLDLRKTEQSPVRCPDKTASDNMLKFLKDIQAKEDSTGGIVTCVISGCPPGIGDPVFGKLQSKLANTMFSIPAVKGFEYGSGFTSAAMTGSTHNDTFIEKNKKLRTLTNHSGGIQGGISNGEDIYFNVAFKPVASIRIKQKTLSRNAAEVEFVSSGRHDICFVPRAVPIVEAMCAIVMADSYLKYLTYAE